MDVEILWSSMYNGSNKGEKPLNLSENAKEDKDITYILNILQVITLYRK